jgi:pyrrolidone-carboxylate peptidase
MEQQWKTICGITLLCFSWFIPGIVRADTPVQANSPYILVSGFEPFGGEKTNGSWEAVQHLQGSLIAGKKIIVCQLPVIWEKASEKLEALMRQYHPVAVVAFGDAGGRPLKVEMVAKNVRNLIQDNAGKLPETSFIMMPDGSRFLFDKAALEKAADIVIQAVAEGL